MSRIMATVYGIFGGCGIATTTRFHQLPDGERVLVAASDLTLSNTLYYSERYSFVGYASGECIADGMRNVVDDDDELINLVKCAEDAGATSIVLGCTDLSMAVNRLRGLTVLPVYDSLEILVEHIFKKSF